MIRSLVTHVLALVLVVTATVPAFAKGPSVTARQRVFDVTSQIMLKSARLRNELARRMANESFLRSEQHKAKIKQLGTNALDKSTKGVAHYSQTMLMLYILTSVEAIRQKYELDRLSGNKPRLEEYLPLLTEAMGLLGNNFELYHAMAGAGVIGAVTRKPMMALRQSIQNQVSNKIFSELIVSGASSFVTFVGWEAGAQLWIEAINMLESEHDIEVAHSLKLFDMLKGAGTPEQKRVMSLIYDNMQRLLVFGNPEKTANWLYNTWRLRIATGDFVALVAGMVTGGQIGAAVGASVGTAIVPVFGTTAGMMVGWCFGIVGGVLGGVLAMYVIPQPVKDAMSAGIKALRRSTNNSTVQGSSLEMRGAIVANRPDIFKMYLNMRRQAREGYATVVGEQYYNAHVKWQEALQQQLMVLAAIDSGERHLQKDADELERKVEQAAAERTRAEDMLVQFYEKEIANLEKFLNGETRGYPVIDLTEPYRSLIALEIQRMKMLRDFLQLITAGTNPQKFERVTGLSDNERAVLPQATWIFLNEIYTNGFDEALILDE